MNLIIKNPINRTSEVYIIGFIRKKCDAANNAKSVFFQWTRCRQKASIIHWNDSRYGLHDKWMNYKDWISVTNMALILPVLRQDTVDGNF